MPRAGKAFSATTSFLALMVAAMLTVFNARRLVFLVAAALDLVERWFSGARTAGNVNDLLPDVLVLSSMRNELASLPGLADSLLALDYPADRLTIGLIDDASTDGSSASMDALADAHGQIHTLHNPVSLGKADSLNAGLARWASWRDRGGVRRRRPPGDLTACDRSWQPLRIRRWRPRAG